MKGRKLIFLDLAQPPVEQLALVADVIRGENSVGKKVAIYVPFSYMFGGVTLYVDKEHVRELDLPVEQALKLAATAQVTREDEVKPPQ